MPHIMTLYNMELCPECKQHYKRLQYPTCIQCLPEERRKAALEAIEFGKKMREMHRDLELTKHYDISPNAGPSVKRNKL